MERISFNDGWEFSRDGGPFEVVVVPHDAMLGNRRGPDAPAGSASGYFHGARYRYRKAFDLDARAAAGTVLLEFEGVYRDARIEVNGCAVEAPPYGFVPFFAELTGLVQPGRNTVEVFADNSGQPDCRWYSGGGIHRPVWLWTGGATRIEPEGVRVTTLSTDPAIVRIEVDSTAGTPLVSIVDDSGAVVAQGEGTPLELEIPHARLWSAEHPALYRCRVELPDTLGSLPKASPGNVGGVMVGIVIEHVGGRIADSAEVAFGIRTVEWSPEGLFVNGCETLLRGGCIHCDNGILGAASWPESERRRIRLLKDAGFNAVRIAHNPAPTSLLEACDEVGMYVMDETWDMWFMCKSPHDYARHFLDWCDHDLRRLIARDYSHPSVVMYSIGNEIADPTAEGGVELERSMVDFVHSLDPTRPVTCGFNLTMMVMERVGRGWYAQSDGESGTSLSDAEAEPPRGSLLFNLAAQATGTGMTMLSTLPGVDALVSPALDALDIAGYNYAAARYAADARKHPNRVVVGSETFPYELPRNWALVERLPNLVGDFMWAGWDYLGEAGAGAWAYTAGEAGFSKPWPWLIAGSGALDILGDPNAHAALAGAVWRTCDGPSIQVRPVNVMEGKTYRATWRGSDAIPSWSWRGCEGLPAQVEVYDGVAEAVRLELDGRIVATRAVRNCVARFELAYRPGTLTAVALDRAGREIARSSISSARGPLRIALVPERAQAAARPGAAAGLGTADEPEAIAGPHAEAGGIAYVSITVADDEGICESNADELVELSVEGGQLLGFGSARPATVESFLSGSYTTYRGRALAAIYRATPGMAVLRAKSRSLPPAATTVEFA